MQKYTFGYINFLLAVVPLHAYIYRVDILIKKMAFNNTVQHIFLLSDWHDFPNKISTHQRSVVTKFCAQKKSEIHVIVEDIGSDEAGLSQGVCQGITIGCGDGLLAGFAQWCRTNRVPCTNVEFRYCRVGACMPVLHSEILTSNDHKKYNTISLHAVINEAEVIKKNIIQKRLPYGDIKKPMFRYNDAYRSYNLDDYLNRNYVGDITKKKFVEQLLISDSYLIDERIIEAIMRYQKIPILVVIAGGSHVKVVRKYLISNGYRIKNTYEQGGKVSQMVPTPLRLDHLLLKAKLL